MHLIQANRFKAETFSHNLALPSKSTASHVPSRNENSLALGSERSLLRRSAVGHLALFLGALVLIGLTCLGEPARAACVVPNTLTNGQTADANQVMSNFAAVADCADAAMVPSGTPTTGNLAVFADPKTITNGDLSGDCSTSGTTALTCNKTSSSQFGMVKIDGTTITENGSGVISAVGGLPTIVTSTNNTGGVSTSPFAFKGISFTCVQSMRITALWIQQLAFVSGGTYNAAIVPISGPGSTGITTTAPATLGAAFTAPSSSTTSVRIAFASPVVLVPGTTYALMVGRTDAGGTYVLPVQSPANTTNGALLLGNFNYIVRVASAAIPPGTVVDTNSGSLGSPLMAFEYQPL